jgi:hypothetical protein
VSGINMPSSKTAKAGDIDDIVTANTSRDVNKVFLIEFINEIPSEMGVKYGEPRL